MTSALSLLSLLVACGSREASPALSPTDVDLGVSVSAGSLDKSAESDPLIPDCQSHSEQSHSEPSDSDECLPPASWVDKLCGGVHPEVALHMFRGGSPWKRLYSRARAPAYNAAGGPSSDERVEKGEELIALRRNGDSASSSAGAMIVGDTAGYDLLRWNGSCVTLQDGEFSTHAPRRREHARVEWRWLGDQVRTALTSDGTVKEAYVARRKECKGATFGSVTKKCVAREVSLVAAIVDYVRSGGPLPDPSERL
jgi:hypothetical protein